VFVLDDGFQHLRLRRDLDVLCLAKGDTSDWPLPAGRLREFARAAARADVSVRVLDGGETPSGPPFFARRRAEGFTDTAGRPQAAPRRALLLSGIARPERFPADVRSLGVEVIAHARFPDHHRYRAPELERVGAEAVARGAEALVTTAKDAVRLPEAALPLPLLVLGMRLELVDERPFLDRLLAVARSAA
jgi:tetraacyldisaccharide 4'-kinase